MSLKQRVLCADADCACSSDEISIAAKSSTITTQESDA